MHTYFICSQICYSLFMRIYGFKKAYKKPLLYIPVLPCTRCNLNFLPTSYGQKMCLHCLAELNLLQNIHNFELSVRREDIIQDILITWQNDPKYKNILEIVLFSNDCYLKESWYTITTDKY